VPPCSAPANPFGSPPQNAQTPVPQNPPAVQPQEQSFDRPASPRIAAQPIHMAFKPGEEKLWNVVGMDLEGLTTAQLTLHYDPNALMVSDVAFGSALKVDPKTPPVVTINSQQGFVTIASSDGTPLTFNSGGEIATLRVRGGGTGESNLVVDSPALKNDRGELVASEVSGGRAKVE